MQSFQPAWKAILAGVLAGMAALIWLTAPAAQAGFGTPTQIYTASYFGGSGTEIITGVAHAPDGAFVVVGKSDNPAFRAGKVFGAGSSCSSTNPGGFIARFTSTGRSLDWYAYFGCGVAIPNKVALDGGGNVYVAGLAKAPFAALISGTFATTINGSDDPFIAKISPDGQNILWGSYQPGESELDDIHLALTGNNEPVISGRASGSGQTNRIFLARFSNDGKFRTAYTTFSDLQNPAAFTHINGLTARSDGLVFAVGYYQRESNLQVPFLIGFNSALPGLNEYWRNYASPVPTNLRADSRGMAVAIDAFGNVIAGFTTDGGNTVLSKNPQNPNEALTVLAGAYQPSHGQANGAALSSFIARYSFANGAILDATFFHSSLGDGRTNTTRIRALATDNLNRVYIAGETACCLPFTSDAFDQNYDGGEGFFAILNPEMSQLVYATYLGGTGKDEFYALSYGSGRVAVAGYTTNNNLLTNFPTQPSTGGGQDGMLAVFAPPYDLQFGTISSPQAVGVNSVSRAITLKLYDNLTGTPVSFLGGDLTVTVSSNSPTGRFNLTPTGSFANNTLTLKLTAGLTYLNFYFLDSTPGVKTITVTPGNGMLPFTYQVTVVTLTAEAGPYIFTANRLGATPTQPLTARVQMLPFVNSTWSVTGVTYDGNALNWLNVLTSTGNAPGTVAFVPTYLPPVGQHTATVFVQDTVYGTFATFNVTLKVNEVKLSIVSGQQTIGAGYNSGAIVVELGDSVTGAPVTLATTALTIGLSSSSSNGTFKGTDGQPTASLSLAPGSYRTFFVYKDGSPGSPTLRVSSEGFNDVTQVITVQDTANCSNLPLTLVNSGADSSDDPCQVTLRAAIAKSATLPEPDRVITFTPGLSSIVLTSTLGTLPDGLRIDGGCSPQNSPLVWLDGGVSGPSSAPLLNAGLNNTLRGLAISGFGGPALQIEAGKNAALGCFYFGTPDGQRIYPGRGAVRIQAGGRLEILPERGVRFFN